MDPATSSSFTVMFHSSCSHPIEVGDRYGSITIFQHSNTAGCESASLDNTTTTAATSTGSTPAAPPTTAAPSEAPSTTSASRVTLGLDANDDDTAVNDDDDATTGNKDEDIDANDDDEYGTLDDGGDPGGSKEDVDDKSVDDDGGIDESFDDFDDNFDDDDNFSGSLCVNGFAEEVCADRNGRFPELEWNQNAVGPVAEDAAVGRLVTTLPMPTLDGAPLAVGQVSFTVIPDSGKGTGTGTGTDEEPIAQGMGMGMGMGIGTDGSDGDGRQARNKNGRNLDLGSSKAVFEGARVSRNAKGGAGIAMPFAVNSSSGAITVAGTLDYEINPVYRIVVVVGMVMAKAVEPTFSFTVVVTINIHAVECAAGFTFSASGTHPCHEYTACIGSLEIVPATATSDRICAVSKTNAGNDGLEGSKKAGAADATGSMDKQASTASGIIVGIIVAMLLLLVLIALAYKRQHKKDCEKDNQDDAANVENASTLDGEREARVHADNIVAHQHQLQHRHYQQHGILGARSAAEHVVEIPQYESAAAARTAAMPIYSVGNSAENPLPSGRTNIVADVSSSVDGKEHALYAHAAQGCVDAAAENSFSANTTDGQTSYDLAAAAAAVPGAGAGAMVQIDYDLAAENRYDLAAGTSEGSAVPGADAMMQSHRRGSIHAFGSEHPVLSTRTANRPLTQSGRSNSYDNALETVGSETTYDVAVHRRRLNTNATSEYDLAAELQPAQNLSRLIVGEYAEIDVHVDEVINRRQQGNVRQLGFIQLQLDSIDDGSAVAYEAAAAHGAVVGNSIMLNNRESVVDSDEYIGAVAGDGASSTTKSLWEPVCVRPDTGPSFRIRSVHRENPLLASSGSGQRQANDVQDTKPI